MASQSYLDLLQKMVDLHINKNAGYSPGEDPWANFRMAEDLHCLNCGTPFTAWQGALIRGGDKWARVIALANNPDADQVGESIEDTLLDLASYALIVLDLKKAHDARSP